MNEILKQDGTVGKALALLDIVALSPEPMRFSDILAQSSYPKATTYRFLQTLTRQAMLTYDENRQTYSLGVRLVRLAHSAWQHSSLAPLARPIMDALSKQLSQTIHLAQLDGGQVLYVDKRNAKNPIEMFSDAGKIGPAYCTGVGKAMLAFINEAERENIICQQSFHAFTDKTITGPEKLRAELAAIRRDGMAFDREEHEPSIICIAVPILSSKGRVLGGMSITSSTERHDLAGLEEFQPPLKQSAEKIGKLAEQWRFPEA